MRSQAAVRRTVVAMSVALVIGLVAAGCSADHAGSGASPLPTVLAQSFPSDTQKQLEQAVADAMKATDSSGAIVGVWAPWSGSWVDGLGTVSPSSKTKVTPEMTFRGGAITRAMTCDALYRLAAAGTVDLDDKASAYVGDVADSSDVTLKSLCDSTSGMGSYGPQLQSLAQSNPQRQWDPRELVGYGLGTATVGATPGARYLESDAGYVLLGLALEKAAGQDATSLLQNEVFGPLGLSSTTLPGGAAAAPTVAGSSALDGFVVPRDAAGALQCKQPADVTRMSASFGSTDSGVVTDITDLGRYVRALAPGALVPAKARFAHPLPVSSTSPSWFTAAGGAIQAGSLIGQYGAMPGYLTAAFADPKTGLTVAVVLNDSTAGRDAVADLAWELAAIASKAAAAQGKTAPPAGLPWTAQQYHDAIAGMAVCGS